MNDIDDLMSRIDEINAKPATELAPDDIDRLIAYHRRARELKVSGVKPATRSKAESKAILDKILPKAEPKLIGITRRL